MNTKISLPLGHAPQMKLPVSERLEISAFEQMLSLKSLTNSYKLYWFSAIFDEIRKGHSEISFRQIVLIMISKCWYSVVAFRLNLGFMDRLNDLVSYLHARYQLEMDISQEELLIFLDELKDNTFEAGVSAFFKYVPYRLISPFYKELKGLKDHQKNKVIETLSQSNDKAIYQVYSREQKIVINPNWLDYIHQNQVIVNGWYYYKLIYFLQKRNPSIPAIPFKLEAPQQRNLSNAKSFWTKIIKIKSFPDVYTGRPVPLTDLSIDHFIPWSFVLHDQLWNLHPTARVINSSKSDGLPNLDLYLERFCDLQYTAVKTALDRDFSMRQLEDYFEISRDIIFSRNMQRDVFVQKLKENLIPLYQLAYNQGFPVWKNQS